MKNKLLFSLSTIGFVFTIIGMAMIGMIAAYMLVNWLLMAQLFDIIDMACTAGAIGLIGFISFSIYTAKA